MSLISCPKNSLTIPCDHQSYSSLALSLILPTYNEGDNIERIINILAEILDKILPNDYELIVVDDNSPDYTWKLALEMISDYPQLQVMRRVEEKGLSTAVIRGWQVAKGNILGVIDADLQHPPEVLAELLQQMQRGADLAVASRHIEGGGVSEWSFARRILSRGAQVLGLVILPEVVGRLSDPMSGYFMVRRDVIADKPLSPVGYKIILEVAARGRVKWIGEVGYVFQEREIGESKVTWRQYIEYLQHLLTLRFSRSARFVQFCLVGLSGVFVDMILLYLLSDPTTLALPLTRSKILAAELAIVNNFFWNELWTFGDISCFQRNKRQRAKRFIKFNIICLGGLILNVLFLNLFFNLFEINRYIANLMAIVIVTIWNYWFNTKLRWRVTERD
ncbi:MAG: glycosyltransferase [Microcystaceae cyanobacterium]